MSYFSSTLSQRIVRKRYFLSGRYIDETGAEKEWAVPSICGRVSNIPVELSDTDLIDKIYDGFGDNGYHPSGVTILERDDKGVTFKITFSGPANYSERVTYTCKLFACDKIEWT